MKRLLLGIAATLVFAPWIAFGAAANAGDQNTVLTPTALYTLIEKENEKTTKLTHVCLKLNQRVRKLEDTQAKLAAALSKRIHTLEAPKVTGSLDTAQAVDNYRFRCQVIDRLTELEHKVAGMQKQITILHAKK